MERRDFFHFSIQNVKKANYAETQNIFFLFVKIIILLLPTIEYLCLGLKWNHGGKLLLSLCSEVLRYKLSRGDENCKWKALCWKSFIIIDISNYCLTKVCVHIDKHQHSERFSTTYYFISDFQNR